MATELNIDKDWLYDVLSNSIAESIEGGDFDLGGYFDTEDQFGENDEYRFTCKGWAIQHCYVEEGTGMTVTDEVDCSIYSLQLYRYDEDTEEWLVMKVSLNQTLLEKMIKSELTWT